MPKNSQSIFDDSAILICFTVLLAPEIPLGRLGKPAAVLADRTIDGD